MQTTNTFTGLRPTSAFVKKRFHYAAQANLEHSSLEKRRTVDTALSILTDLCNRHPHLQPMLLLHAFSQHGLVGALAVFHTRTVHPPDFYSSLFPPLPEEEQPIREELRFCYGQALQLPVNQYLLNKLMESLLPLTVLSVQLLLSIYT